MINWKGLMSWKDDIKNIDWQEVLLTSSGSYLPGLKKEVQELLKEEELKGGSGRPGKFISYAVGSKLIKNASLRAGAVGGLTCLPATLPLIGSIGTVLLGSAVDLVVMLRMQVELCFAMSVAYGVEMSEDELKAVTLAILGFSGSAEAVKAATAGALRRTVDELAVYYMKAGLARATTEVAERLIPRLLRSAYRIIPFLSIPLGASINITSTMMVGNQARKYFNTWMDDGQHETGKGFHIETE
ncbi:MAG: EcsC family protein [Nitrospirae bacterium]|nr:EcsC family protein [Nitrospirota bacterium]